MRAPRSFAGRRVAAAVTLFALIATSSAVGAGGPAPGPRMVAEWEPALGTLIRWPLGLPFDVVRELARDDLLYTLVSGPTAESQARSTFAAEGIDLANVVFIHASIYSMWTRDWGPQAVCDAQGALGYADPWFAGYPWVGGCYLAAAVASQPLPERSGRGYEQDDAIPAVVAAFLGVPHHPLQAYLTGGNIMTDGLGLAWSTEQMVAENAAHMNLDTFLQRVGVATGVSDYRFVISPEVYGIQHIDCYAKLLDEETVLVKQVPADHWEHACCEYLAGQFAAALTCYGRPYRVLRIWCPPYSGNHVAAYTNSLILNRKVLVPLFGLASDAAALQSYRDALPGYDVHGFFWGSWYSYDALHCRTMGIFDPGMLRLLHARVEPLVPAGQDHEIRVYLEVRSGEPLVPGAQLVRWRLAGDTSWQDVTLTASGADSLVAAIPAQAPGAVVEYHVTAADQSGRSAALPRGAPEGFYSFAVDAAAAAPPALPVTRLLARPNPFNPRAELVMELAAAAVVRLQVFDARGRLVAHVHEGRLPAGRHIAVWDGTSDCGRAAPGGVYLARLESDGVTVVRKLVLAP